MYCTITDLLNAGSETDLIQLTDDSNTGAYSETIINSAITDASALVDSYAGGRYILPLPPASLIKNITVDVAYYYIYKRRFRTAMPDSILDAYKLAEKQLQLIQKGTLDIVEATAISSPSGTGTSRTNAPEKIFTKDLLDRY